MLGLFSEFEADFKSAGVVGVPAQTTQVLTEDELIAVLPEFDGWIIGDDPASKRVVAAANAGQMRAAVKWGVGTDNVDFPAFAELGVPVENTPGVFGQEVADVALTYALGLARETYWIDRQIRYEQSWPKPSGISLSGRKVGVVGFGDIGQQTARRLIACGSQVIAYDPYFAPVPGLEVDHETWPNQLSELDFLIFTCPLTPETEGLFNHDTLGLLKRGVRIVNVARGPIIIEAALVDGLQRGIVHSAALDVFEIEPLPAASPLRNYDRCIFGSHNGSNSKDAVRRVSRIAIEKIARMLN